MKVINTFPAYDTPEERAKMLQRCYNGAQKKLAQYRSSEKRESHECNLCQTVTGQKK